jgi:hypothetical protein
MQADWHNLGDALYRKWHVYDMGLHSEGFQLDNYTICGAQYGGPIAMINDDKKGNLNEENGKKLLIFKSSGLKISEIEWDLSRRVVGMGWSDEEQLLVVLEDGNTLLTSNIDRRIVMLLHKFPGDRI